MWRNKLLGQREPLAVKAKIGQAVVVGLLIMALWWKGYGWGDPVTAANTTGCLYFANTSLMMQYFFSTILVFQRERPVFLREQSNLMYDVMPYYLAKVALEMPVLIVGPLLMQLEIYWSVKFEPGAQAWFSMYLALMMTAQNASALGYFLSACFSSMEQATIFGPVIMMPVILFGGLFANGGNYSLPVGWAQYLSPIRFAFEASLRGQLAEQPDDIKDSTLEGLSFKIGYWWCIGCLVGLMMLFRILGAVVLKLLVGKFQ